MNLTSMPAGDATTGDPVSLTPEEIAMCRDALLEAGVPAGVVDRILWTKDRLRRIRATNVIDEDAYALRPPEPYVASMKRELYAKIVRRLIDEQIVAVTESRGLRGVELRLDMTVLTPHGWKSPAKEPR